MFFGHGVRVSRRRVVLLLFDVLWIASALVLSSILRLGWIEGLAYVQEHLPSLGGSCFIFLLVFYAAGMYEREAVVRKGSSFQLPFIATAVGLLIITAVFYARFHLHIGRGVLFLASIFIFLGSWAIRQLLRVALGYGMFSKNTLIVGEGNEAEDIIANLARHTESGYRLFGLVSFASHETETFVKGLPVLGHISSLREFVTAYDIETIIIATALSREPSLLRVLRPLRYAGVEMLDYVTLHEELAQEIPLDHIDDEWLMNAAMNSSRIHNRKIKRILDVSVSVVGLALLALPSLVAMLVIKLTSKGPVVFRQERAGLDGRKFTLLKFRTMWQGAEAESGAVWAGAADARVTPPGKFLRKCRLDEVPQLINVLRGEMSLVGPRPERHEFIETLAGAIPFYKERLLVPPGITGWAQVIYPYAASVDASRRKLQYDLYYIKNMSLFLDILILLRTFKTIIIGLRHSEAMKEPRIPEKQTDANIDRAAG